MRAKILHLITTLEPDGAQTLLLDTIRHMTNLPYEFAVGYLSGPGSAMAGFRPAGVEIIDLSRGGRPDSLLPARLIHLIRRRRFQVIHTHLVHAGVVGKLCALVDGDVRLVTTRHYAWNQREGSLLYRLENRLTRRCALVIAVSEAVRRYLIEERIAPESKILTIPNGVDTTLFQPGDPARPRPTLTAGPVFGSVGRLHPEKGHAVLLRALPPIFKQYKNAVLEIIGEGAARPELEEEARRQGIAERVRFLGALPHASIPERMAQWDLLVIPSLSEGFGIAAAEAMAMERAVVASRVEGLVEVVEDGVTGILVTPGDSAAMTEAILGLLADEKRAGEMGRRGRARVLQRFSIAQTAAKVDKAYQALLSSRT